MWKNAGVLIVSELKILVSKIWFNHNLSRVSKRRVIERVLVFIA